MKIFFLHSAAVLSLFLAATIVRADSIRAYFNHNQESTYTDPYYDRTRPGDNLEALLLNEIEKAQKSISIAAYQIDLPKVAIALVAKKNQGVQVRIVLENQNSSPFKVLTPEEVAKLDEHALAKYNEFFNFSDANHDGQISTDELATHDSITIIKNGLVSMIDDTSDGSKGSGLMHHKFMIVDQSVLITGSANFTRSCIHGDSNHPNSLGNANSLLRIESPSLISLFSTEFDELYVKHHFGLKKTFRGAQTIKINQSNITLQFSPTSKKYGWEASTNGLIAKQFSTAHESSDLALFVFSEQAIVDQMQIAQNLHGMKTRTLIDPSFATRYYSELLDIFGLKMPNPKCGYEEGNRPWSNPSLISGFTSLDAGDLLHHKFGVIDHKKVIVGSHNWSDAANRTNDEALLVLDNSEIANAYGKEFEYLYHRAVIGPQDWLIKKISDQEKACGHSL